MGQLTDEICAHGQHSFSSLCLKVGLVDCCVKTLHHHMLPDQLSQAGMLFEEQAIFEMG